MTLKQLIETFNRSLRNTATMIIPVYHKQVKIEPVRVGVTFSKHELSYGNIDEDHIKDILIQRMLSELKKHMVMTATNKPFNDTTEYQATILIGAQ